MLAPGTMEYVCRNRRERVEVLAITFPIPNGKTSKLKAYNLKIFSNFQLPTFTVRCI
jgi:hypothetical protein